jgi:hypothetical protein
LLNERMHDGFGDVLVLRQLVADPADEDNVGLVRVVDQKVRSVRSHVHTAKVIYYFFRFRIRVGTKEDAHRHNLALCVSKSRDLLPGSPFLAQPEVHP